MKKAIILCIGFIVILSVLVGFGIRDRKSQYYKGALDEWNSRKTILIDKANGSMMRFRMEGKGIRWDILLKWKDFQIGKPLPLPKIIVDDMMSGVTTLRRSIKLP